MESSFSSGDLRDRLYYSQSVEQPSLSPVTMVQQGLLDRQLFEMRLREVIDTITLSFETAFTSSDAVKLIQAITPTLDRSYGWFTSVDPEVLSRLINEVAVFREEYLTDRGEMPSDARIYREYRRHLETTETTDEYSYEATLILEVLLSGDITNGTLPPFTPSE